MKQIWRAVLFVAFLSLLRTQARAQDLFEIQVYEYETVEKCKWNLETHFGFMARGTREFEGKVAPTDGQAHLAFELTRGITEDFEMAAYLILARPEGKAPEYAGVRLRPRIKAPERWKLPVDLSLSIEVAFPRPQYEANSVTFELRPIIEKTFSRARLSFNPVMGRALRGPDRGEGFEFEPGAKIAYFLRSKDKVNLGIEYYGSTGPITGFRPIDDQVHLIFPTADFYLSDHTLLNLGVGFGLTPAGEKLIVKARLGHQF